MISQIERIKTLIPGFDELVNGGIPKRNVVLLSGGPGTGKSIFAQQFVFNGLKQNENGI
ncbi:MAG: ATPase domain-containing protein, partial [Candidatus Aenigmatarchaeota archaeon]